MIGIFKPVDNKYGYDVRYIRKEGNRVKTKRLNIEQHKNILHELKIYKPKKFFTDRFDFYKQFNF